MSNLRGGPRPPHPRAAASSQLARRRGWCGSYRRVHAELPLAKAPLGHRRPGRSPQHGLRHPHRRGARCSAKCLMGCRALGLLQDARSSLSCVRHHCGLQTLRLAGPGHHSFAGHPITMLPTRHWRRQRAPNSSTTVQRTPVLDHQTGLWEHRATRDRSQRSRHCGTSKSNLQNL